MVYNLDVWVASTIGSGYRAARCCVEGWVSLGGPSHQTTANRRLALLFICVLRGRGGRRSVIVKSGG